MIPRTFVVPLDGSPLAERAVPVAIGLAGRVGGSVVLMASTFDGPLGGRDYLDRVQAAHADAAVDIDIEVADGVPPGEAIMKAVSERDDRIACMTSHGRSGLRWAALGSIAEDVVRTSDRAVLLVGRHCDPGTPAHRGPIVVALDGSDPSPELVDATRAWTHALAAPARSVLVVHPLDVESATHAEDLTATLAAPLRRAGIEHDARLLRAGHVAGAIADEAERCGAPLVIMGAHGRRGVARLAVGSVTMGVVHSASCPVLAVPVD
jgi:nucleotide-binding universal stress UspA family protein